MKEFVSKLKFPYKFILFGTVVCLAIFIVENINDRFRLNDLKVYYEAAQALLHGNQVYGIPFGLDTGYYKYSPATLLLFIPYCAFSFEVAKVLHFIVLSCCAVFTIVFLRRMVNKYWIKGKDKNRLLTAIFICILIHLVRELHLGNINIILVLLVSAAVHLLLSDRAKYAGWLLGLVFVTKPYFLLLLLPLVLHQKKTTLLHIGLAFVFFGLAPAAVIGFPENLALHQEWVKAMLDHNSYLESDNTMPALLQAYTSVAAPEYFIVYVLAVLGLIYTLVFWLNRQKAVELGEEAGSFMDRMFMIEIFVLMALIPNLVITDTEHFLYSLPIIVMLVSYLQKQKDYRLMTGFIVTIIFYGGNSSDLLGRQLSRQFDDFGALGLSNLLLIGFTVLYVYFKEGNTFRRGEGANAADAY